MKTYKISEKFLQMGKKISTLTLILSIIIVFVGYNYLYFSNNGGVKWDNLNNIDYLNLLMLFLIIMLIVVGISYIVIKRNYKKMRKKWEPYSIQFYEDGIIINNTDLSCSNIRFDEITKMSYSPAGLSIDTNDDDKYGYISPFTNEYDEIIKILSQHGEVQKIGKK